MTFLGGGLVSGKGCVKKTWETLTCQTGLDKWSLPGGNGESVLYQGLLEQTYRSTKV